MARKSLREKQFDARVRSERRFSDDQLDTDFDRQVSEESTLDMFASNLMDEPTHDIIIGREVEEMFADFTGAETHTDNQLDGLEIKYRFELEQFC